MTDSTTVALRQRIQALDERIEEMYRRREKLVGALQILEEDDQFAAPVTTVAVRPTTQRPATKTAPPRERPDGEPTLPEVIIGIVRAQEGQTTSAVTDQVLRRFRDQINSEDPRRVVLTRIGQLVSGERLVKDEQKRLFLPAHSLALNGNGHH